MNARMLQAVLTVGLPNAIVAQGGGSGFRFEDVRSLAAERATTPHRERKSDLAAFWIDLAPEDYRKITPRLDEALWTGKGSGFAVALAPPGGPYPKPVIVSEVAESGEPKEIFWRQEMYDFGDIKVPAATPSPLGFAGFHVLAPINDPAKMDEVATFQGASYFRAVAPGLTYGLSARGLALNTGQPGGEEFPDFERFWIEKPGAGAKSMNVYALLDSPSVAGAYQFRITPGRATVIAVDSEVIFRQEVESIGFAPFSSMFWHGELTQPQPADYRPEAHESDGLLVQTGETDIIWRPLDNGAVVRHSVQKAEKLKGFGLIQRDRSFDHYQDLAAGFELRPSAWVEPVGAWPPGKIHLIELPTKDASWGNVVCFWTPDRKPPPGQPFRLSYRIHWLPEMSIPGVSKVLATRRAAVAASGSKEKPIGPAHEFVIDFSPPSTSEDDHREPVVYVEVGEKVKLVDRRAEKNPHTGGWRAVFRVEISDALESAELACRLLSEGRPTSEKWSYLWKKQP